MHTASTPNLTLTLFPSLPKSGNSIKTTTSKTKMYSICTVGPSVSPTQQQGFYWVAQFGVVNHLNLLVLCAHLLHVHAIVALHWKVDVKLGWYMVDVNISLHSPCIDL